MEEERENYRMKCKHLGMEDMCFLHSGGNGYSHITMACNCNCRRMKNYDRKHKTTRVVLLPRSNRSYVGLLVATRRLGDIRRVL